MTTGTAPTTAPREKRSATHYVTIGVRLLMGLMFFVFGLNGFFNFFPPPPGPLPELITALMKSGYMIKLIAGTQVVTGILFLTNRFVPLAIALIAPVIVNIVAFHVFAEPSGIGIAIVVAAMEIFLAWSYRSAFRPMLAARTSVG